MNSSSMPPKTSAASKQTPKGPSKQELDAINAYLAEKPDFHKLVAEATKNGPVQIERTETEYDRKLNAAVKESLRESRKEAETVE